MKKKNTAAYSLLILFAILIVVNMLSTRFFARLDFTEDQRYTLSEATRNILEELTEPVTVTAYFSEDLPTQMGPVKNEFKEMLIEYANRSHGNVVYEFIDPGKDEKIQQEAMQNGIQPILITVQEKDQAVQKRAYLGAVIQVGESSEVMPVIQSGSAMEYGLSTSIKKLVVTDKPVIGFIQGHGEASLSEMGQAIQGLNILYNVESVNLTDSTNMSKYKAIGLIRPRDTIPENQLALLDNYLANGGSMFIAADRVNSDLGSSIMGNLVSTGLESWLAAKGINVAPSFLIDANCGSVTIPQRIGAFTVNAQASFPYLPIITNFHDHPAVEGLETMMMMFASPIRFSGDSSITYTPLASASEKCNELNAPLYFDVQKRWTEADFPQSNLVVSALFEGKLSGPQNARLILITDGDLAVNGMGQQARQLQPDNVNFMVNSIDWLSDDTGLINLRTKGITSRMLEQVEDGKKSFYKWLNFLLPILLVVFYGIFRAQRNRMIRIKRMEENYV